jgi:hypothetical protein
MRKKKTRKRLYQDWNFDAMRWCIDNDFQVYVHHINRKINDNYYQETFRYKIAVRRGGITTEGLDQIEINGRITKSKETLSDKEYKSEADAFNDFNYVYEHLRRKYG